MECRIHLNIDCTYAKKTDNSTESNLTKLLKGQLDEPDRDYSVDEVKEAFCNLIDA